MTYLNDIFKNYFPEAQMMIINGKQYDIIDTAPESGDIEIYRFGEKDYIKAIKLGCKAAYREDLEKESYIAIDSITEISFIEKN